jgi:hypothetical protein
MGFADNVTKGTMFYLLVLAILVGLTLNFRQDLGIIYGLMIMFILGIHSQIKVRYNLNQIPRNTAKAVGMAVLAFLFFIMVSYLSSTLLQSILKAEPTLGSVMKAGFLSTGLSQAFIDQFKVLIQTSLFERSFTTILSNAGTIFSFAILIPIIETAFAGALMEFLGKIFSVDIKLGSVKSWLIFILVGLFITWLHFTAKGVSNNLALFMTFIFFAGTCALIVGTKELEAATDLHIFNNGFAIFKALGLI